MSRTTWSPAAFEPGRHVLGLRHTGRRVAERRHHPQRGAVSEQRDEFVTERVLPVQRARDGSDARTPERRRELSGLSATTTVSLAVQAAWLKMPRGAAPGRYVCSALPRARFRPIFAAIDVYQSSARVPQRERDAAAVAGVPAVAEDAQLR